MLSVAVFVIAKHEQANKTDDEWYESTPRGPGVLHTTPGEGDHERCRAAHEDGGADVIDSPQFGEKGSWYEVEAEEEDGHD